jgi:hypothetical protein
VRTWVAILLLVVVPGARAASGPTVTAQPSIAGTLQVGKKLSAQTGTWLASDGAAYSFQWYRCDAKVAHCASVHGATGAMYTQVAKDAGKAIAVSVRATDGNGTATAYAPAAGLVAPATAPVAVTAQPTLEGDPIVGTALELHPGTWTATPPAAATYAWLRCNANGRACATIGGRTTPSYTLTAADVGHTVIVAASDAKQTVLSLRTAVVRMTPGPLLVAAPSVTGTLQQGAKLTASPGAWTSGGTLAFGYQWYRCDAAVAHCASVQGATKPTYTTVSKDVEHAIALTVRATDATGTTAAYAPAAGLIAPRPGPAVAGQPALVGDAKVGTALTAQPPKWSLPQRSVTYGWLRCNPNGRACISIAGARARTYTLAAADAAHTVIVAATASEQTVLSVPSALVHT